MAIIVARRSGKMSKVMAWNLPYSMRRVDAILLDNTTVTIDGWTYERGSITCTVFGFDNKGILLDELADRGCVARK